MLLPPALGFSPHLPVSVCGTGLLNTIAAFLDTESKSFSTKLRSASGLQIVQRLFLLHSYLLCTGLFIPGSLFLHVSPHF